MRGRLERPDRRGSHRDHARPRHTLGIAYCTVSCAAAEAQDLLQYFQGSADIFSARGDARASACAVAVDNLRLALRLAGLS